MRDEGRDDRSLLGQAASVRASVSTSVTLTWLTARLFQLLTF